MMLFVNIFRCPTSAHLCFPYSGTTQGLCTRHAYTVQQTDRAGCQWVRNECEQYIFQGQEAATKNKYVTRSGSP